MSIVIKCHLHNGCQGEDELGRARVEVERPPADDVENDEHRGGRNSDVMDNGALAIFFGQRVDDLTHIPAWSTVSRVHQFENEGQTRGIECHVD